MISKEILIELLNEYTSVTHTTFQFYPAGYKYPPIGILIEEASFSARSQPTVDGVPYALAPVRSVTPAPYLYIPTGGKQDRLMTGFIKIPYTHEDVPDDVPDFTFNFELTYIIHPENENVTLVTTATVDSETMAYDLYTYMLDAPDEPNPITTIYTILKRLHSLTLSLISVKYQTVTCQHGGWKVVSVK